MRATVMRRKSRVAGGVGAALALGALLVAGCDGILGLNATTLAQDAAAEGDVTSPGNDANGSGDASVNEGAVAESGDEVEAGMPEAGVEAGQPEMEAGQPETERSMRGYRSS